MKTLVNIPTSAPWALHTYQVSSDVDRRGWKMESGTSIEQVSFRFLCVRHRFRSWLRLIDLQDLVRRWKLAPEDHSEKNRLAFEIMNTVALESPLGEAETQALFDHKYEAAYVTSYLNTFRPSKFSGRKRRGTSMFRRPRTFQSRRMALVADPEDVPPRAKQRQLPNSWDDLVRGDLNYRSWKHYRLTHWKADR
jgi:hypothetical protein